VAPWLVVWFVVGIVSTAAIIACLVGLLRHLLILGRTVKALQEAVRPVADDVANERQTAGTHVAAIGRRRRTGSSGRPPG
jgi:hypothetical protein